MLCPFSYLVSGDMESNTFKESFHMKYLDEFRDPQLAKSLIEGLQRRPFAKREIRLMEICGTHTVAIFRSGLKQLLPPEIKLISGPGCPVCVTANEDIDRAIWLAQQPGVIITTFGDLMRVPGSFSSLHVERSKGADVRMVYATLDALQIARDNPERQVVFIGIGFETTSPTIAAAVQQASKLGVDNFSVLLGPQAASTRDEGAAGCTRGPSGRVPMPWSRQYRNRRRGIPGSRGEL